MSILAFGEMAVIEAAFGWGEPVPDESGAKDPQDLVLAAIGEIRASMADLISQVTREHDRAQARERIIDRLHQEAEGLKAGQTREVLRPVVADLRRLRDDLVTQARSVPETMARRDVAALLESYADSVALILERCGVIPVRPAPETTFDAHRQQVSGVTETAQPTLDGTIASVVNDGYAEVGTGQQVAPARVIVYRHADVASRVSEPGEP